MPPTGSTVLNQSRDKVHSFLYGCRAEEQVPHLDPWVWVECRRGVKGVEVEEGVGDTGTQLPSVALSRFLCICLSVKGPREPFYHLFHTLAGSPRFAFFKTTSILGTVSAPAPVPVRLEPRDRKTQRKPPSSMPSHAHPGRNGILIQPPQRSCKAWN